jgi:lysozyme family protein
MIYSDSDNWLKYTNHVLREEGKTSKDPNDKGPASCVKPGQIHTNKGVTFCTFRDRADKLGISPVTYERFLALTNEDVAKFIYSYYNQINGSSYPDSIALALTEINWMSGPDRPFKILFQALSNLGQPVTTKKESIIAVDKLPEKVLFDEIIKERKKHLESLLKSPTYANNTGWIPRLKRFYDSFNPDVIGSKKKLTAVLLFPILLVIFFLIFKKSK